MKDAIGQEVSIGDKIIHCGGNYASARQYEVIGITEQRFQVHYAPHGVTKINLRPDTVINITSNLKILEESKNELQRQS